MLPEITPLTQGWQLALAAPGERAHPQQLEGLTWIDAVVPGTAAMALHRAGRFNLQSPQALDSQDVWYRCRLPTLRSTDDTLAFEGLATLADVWIGEQHVLRSENMFHAHRVPIQAAQGGQPLTVRFGALAPWVATRKGRARWRAVNVPSSLRWARTTMLGRLPGWAGAVQPVGPFREVWLGARPLDVDAHATLEGDTGVVRLRVKGVGSGTLRLAGAAFPLAASGDGLGVEARVPGVKKWWPHTHGTPALYPLELELDGEPHRLGPVGFRSLELDQAGGGFALRVNGERVFCRGASWTCADLLSLAGGSHGYRHHVGMARDAGMNMFRLPGQSLYEHDEFYRTCDELGIMVWQDFLFAGLDYPTSDSAFEASVRREADHFLRRTRLNPSLSILCGGSEMEQQAAMLGLPPEAWSSVLCAQWLPEASRGLRPDVPYLRNTPWGGPLPFLPQSGVSHYYGVGAYLRPPDDARRANVRFAAECLAFANTPAPSTLRSVSQQGPLAQIDWLSREVADPGAERSFADVRDHYLTQVFGLEPKALRRADVSTYLRLGAEAVGEVMTQTFAEWRRRGSSCAGGLVWYFQDLAVAEGLGLVDALGVPKPVFSVLSRALQPQAAFLLDEGLNGLSVHVVNDCGEELVGKLSLVALRDGRVPVAKAEREIRVPPRSAWETSTAELLGTFFDFSFAYRFGPQPHQVTALTLRSLDGKPIAEAFHFPGQRPSGPTWPVALSVACSQSSGRWSLALSSDALVQSVRIDDLRFSPRDDGFHLLPGEPRVVELVRRGVGSGPPQGTVSAVNLAAPVRYQGANP